MQPNNALCLLGSAVYPGMEKGGVIRCQIADAVPTQNNVSCLHHLTTAVNQVKQQPQANDGRLGHTLIWPIIY